jgi:hypothetical protein
MYGHFYYCPNCNKKGYYIKMRYLGGPPDYWGLCRYCEYHGEGRTDDLIIEKSPPAPIPAQGYRITVYWRM